MSCFKNVSKGREPIKCRHGAEVHSLYIHPPSKIGKQLRADLTGQSTCKFTSDELRKMSKTSRQIIGCLINPFKSNTRPIRITSLSSEEMQYYRILYKNRELIKKLREGYEELTNEVYDLYVSVSSDDSSESGTLNHTRQTPDELGAFHTANEK